MRARRGGGRDPHLLRSGTTAMTELRFRGAVSPPRRPQPAPQQPLPRGVDALVAHLRPEEPLHCLRPATIAGAARAFLASFPGQALYAVKCNPEPAVLRALWQGGVRHFDCASIAEVRLVRSMFAEADIHFMHPVKPRGAIREAWQRHSVRDFVLDSAEELAKLLEETGGNAGDLGLVVRIALPKGMAVYDLSGKFGAAAEDAVALLRAARPHAARLGVSFHVGSQCLEPSAYASARPAWRWTSSMSAAAIPSPTRMSCRRRSAPSPRRSPSRWRSRASAAWRSGRSPAVRWWRAAPRWWCRCSTAAATRCS
jgi:hypothetical protein